MIGMVSLQSLVVALLSVSLRIRRIQAQPPGMDVVHVRYGRYFSETRPMLAACARGWLDLAHVETNTYYKVGCYPQASGNFVSSRLDNLELDIAHIGSTPWAQGRLVGRLLSCCYLARYEWCCDDSLEDLYSLPCYMTIFVGIK